MKRVTGIGGVFFKAKDAPALRAWYKQHLGIDVQSWGGAAFDWTDSTGKPTGGTTAWLIASETSNQFAPSNAFHIMLPDDASQQVVMPSSLTTKKYLSWAIGEGT